MKKLTYFLQVVIGALFIAAAIGKLPLIESVQREIEAYQLIPVSLTFAGSIMLICYEFITGVWLLTNKKADYALGAAFFILTLFIVAKASAVIRGIEIACNVCFGTFLSLPLWANLIVNLSMMAVIVFVYWHRNKGLSHLKRIFHMRQQVISV